MNVRKHRLLDHLRIVSTEPDAHVKRAFKRQLDGCSHLVKRFATQAQEHGDDVSVLLQTNPLWRVDVQLNVLRGVARGAAVLQRGQACAVLSRIGVGTVCIEVFPKHQDSLAVRIGSTGMFSKSDICSKRNIARHLLPRKVKRVHRGPDVLSRRSERVGPASRVVGERSGRVHAADIGLPVEEAQGYGVPSGRRVACSQRGVKIRRRGMPGLFG